MKPQNAEKMDKLHCPHCGNTNFEITQKADWNDPKPQLIKMTCKKCKEELHLPIENRNIKAIHIHPNTHNEANK